MTAADIADSMDPSRYIEKVSLVTGEVLDETIEPDELLVSRYRDYHVVDMQARRILSRMVAATGDPGRARARMRRARRLGHRTAEILSKITPKADPDTIAKALFGLARREHYFRYRRTAPPAEEAEEILRDLRETARERLERAAGSEDRGLRVLLTGGTGFVGKEVLCQAAEDSDISEILVLIRPKRGLSASERGSALLGELGLEELALTEPESRDKIRFVDGDVTEPDLGISREALSGIEGRITHLVHCAASVAFDDPYEKSFRANVSGTLNALRLSRRLHRSPDSVFVTHVAIETAYIHGRRHRVPAREDDLVFPRSYYNNYYELTKAMASLEAQRFMFEEEVPVVQLCPAIVIGHEESGNNRGDTKVVNAPVNLFGRAQQAIRDREGSWLHRSQVGLMAWIATIFPADPSAELNLIPVDWVARGILASLKSPDVVGERIHLATDKRISSARMQEIVEEELGTQIKLAEPTLHRNVILPVLAGVLRQLGQKRLSRGLEKLADVFGNYGEWAQPVHEVAKDVALLGLPEDRPDTVKDFRMLCRHNRWVQRFGKIRDGDEIARREGVWEEFLEALEERLGRDPAELSAPVFRSAVRVGLDRETFELDRKGLREWQPSKTPELEPPTSTFPFDKKGLATVAVGAAAAGAVAVAVHRARSKKDSDESRKDPDADDHEE
ncbi:MAG: SDR family oxidoreductase [Thermoanaerobaculia bacterium]|nr:SDR family oxidoreductase [Thermoanaerobaculia bacterium]